MLKKSIKKLRLPDGNIPEDQINREVLFRNPPDANKTGFSEIRNRTVEDFLPFNLQNQ